MSGGVSTTFCSVRRCDRNSRRHSFARTCLAPTTARWGLWCGKCARKRDRARECLPRRGKLCNSRILRRKCSQVTESAGVEDRRCLCCACGACAANSVACRVAKKGKHWLRSIGTARRPVHTRPTLVLVARSRLHRGMHRLRMLRVQTRRSNAQ